eukprot:TRINITY_DN11262_c0_g1_i9.p1 TRINITY_DN11262_c0_g1~~TRINITY_DN11262_c0_g1_i9.p1  ORF type:complete len:372 (-),score=114.04 TRINITY_DN11262_c0_g1_i9:56-1171(-)
MVVMATLKVIFFFFQAEDGIRDAQESRGLGDVYKRQDMFLSSGSGRRSFQSSRGSKKDDQGSFQDFMMNDSDDQTSDSIGGSSRSMADAPSPTELRSSGSRKREGKKSRKKESKRVRAKSRPEDTLLSEFEMLVDDPEECPIREFMAGLSGLKLQSDHPLVVSTLKDSPSTVDCVAFCKTLCVHQEEEKEKAAAAAKLKATQDAIRAEAEAKAEAERERRSREEQERIEEATRMADARAAAAARASKFGGSWGASAAATFPTANQRADESEEEVGEMSEEMEEEIASIPDSLSNGGGAFEPFEPPSVAQPSLNPPSRLTNTVIYNKVPLVKSCLLYTSDAADEEDSVDLGGRRIIKKKKKRQREIHKSREQ